MAGPIGPLDLPFGVPALPPAGVTRCAVDNAGNLIVSVGGVAWTKVANQALITTGVGLSGDGSSGTPAKLATGTRITASGAQAALDITGLAGATDGGYHVEGNIIHVGVNKDYLIQLNGVTSGYTTQVNYGAINATINQTGNLGAGSETSGFGIIRADGGGAYIRMTIGPTNGTDPVFVQGIAMNYVAATGAPGNPGFNYFNGIFLPAAPITEIKLVTGDGSANFATGSWLRYRPLGLTA